MPFHFAKLPALMAMPGIFVYCGKHAASCSMPFHFAYLLALVAMPGLRALMAMSGYLLTIVTTERITRKNLQLLGFLALGFLYVLLGCGMASLSSYSIGLWHGLPALLLYLSSILATSCWAVAWFDCPLTLPIYHSYVLLGCGMAWLSSYSGALIFTYGLTFFFSNFGPNSTTFIVPGEAPQIKTCVRSTSHGLSAAFGKLGAVLGTSVLTPLVERYGLPTVLVVCGVLSFAGLLWTLLFVPQYRTQDLEEADRTEQQAAEHAAALLTHADKEPEHDRKPALIPNRLDIVQHTERLVNFTEPRRSSSGERLTRGSVQVSSETCIWTAAWRGVTQDSES
eukprot:g77221.t1